jgi:Fur family zinc uptake transcriptional regulator
LSQSSAQPRSRTAKANASASKKAQAGWLQEVEDACASRGLQLTPLRRRVLSILGEGGGPLGAYAILERLSKLESKHVAPPTVYRTLDFFVENGFLHKIESRNVFTPCEHLGHRHGGVLLICERCGRSEEVEDASLEKSLRRTAERAGFAMSRQMVELQGVCSLCGAQGAGADL